MADILKMAGLWEALYPHFVVVDLSEFVITTYIGV